MNFFANLFRKKASRNYSRSDIEVITASAQRLADIINESLKISNDSKNPETKFSRLNVAKDKLSEIKDLSTKYSFLSLTTLIDVERSIAELESEYLMAGYKEIANGNIAAEALEKEDKIEEAIVQYEKLVSQKADTPFTYRRLAILYRKEKNEKDEIRVIQSALINIPESNSKHYNWFQDRLAKKGKNA